MCSFQQCSRFTGWCKYYARFTCTPYTHTHTHTHAHTHTHTHTHACTHARTHTHTQTPVLSCFFTAEYGHANPNWGNEARKFKGGLLRVLWPTSVDCETSTTVEPLLAGWTLYSSMLF